jgi:hypothetical protein
MFGTRSGWDKAMPYCFRHRVKFRELLGDYKAKGRGSFQEVANETYDLAAAS